MNTNYFTGYKYTKSITVPVTITYTRSMFQPPVTGPTTVKTDDSYNDFTIDLTDYILDSTGGITVTNANYTYDSSTNVIRITDVTGPVTINITAHGIPCTIFVGGAQGGETQSTFTGSYPSTGTIKYTDIYGIQQIVNVADLGCSVGWRQSPKYARIYDVLVGSDIVCTNIGVTTKNGSGTTSGYYVSLRFGNVGTSYDSYSVTSSSRISYTFTNVQKEDYYEDADIRIRSTR